MGELAIAAAVRDVRAAHRGECGRSLRGRTTAPSVRGQARGARARARLTAACSTTTTGFATTTPAASSSRKLVEAILVHETYFFRELAPLAAAGRWSPHPDRPDPRSRAGVVGGVLDRRGAVHARDAARRARRARSGRDRRERYQRDRDRPRAAPGGTAARSLRDGHPTRPRRFATSRSPATGSRSRRGSATAVRF